MPELIGLLIFAAALIVCVRRDWTLWHLMTGKQRKRP